jgi:hypothetical protein
MFTERKGKRKMAAVANNLNHVSTPSVIGVVGRKAQQLFNAYILSLSKALFISMGGHDPKAQAYTIAMMK